VKVKKLPLGSLSDMPAAPGKFQPARLVINFGVVEEDHDDIFVTEFDPPIELRVRYTQGDLQRAQQDGQSLTLAFWNGSEWVPFTQQKHQFRLEPSGQGQSGGLGVATIRNWGDPPVGWGS
jgi:hypothetical protein